MSELGEKIKAAISRIKHFESLAADFPDKDGNAGYYLAFSGGKDSVVINALMDLAGVKYDAHYRVTSVDPPELVQFIREKYPDVHRDIPRYPQTETYGKYAGRQVTMWNLIPRKLMPPTRLVRYCCQWLKEGGGDFRWTVTGVRWAESDNRAKNQGIITIPDRNAYKTLGDDPNFQSTVRGGWYS